MEVIETQPEIDYVKIGQRIRAARLEKGYSQADLGALVGCSNNHMSHVEVGQTKVSLAMLLKLAFVLEKNFDYFLLDTPYAKCDSIIDNEIAAKDFTALIPELQDYLRVRLKNSKVVMTVRVSAPTETVRAVGRVEKFQMMSLTMHAGMQGKAEFGLELY